MKEHNQSNLPQKKSETGLERKRIHKTQFTLVASSKNKREDRVLIETIINALTIDYLNDNYLQHNHPGFENTALNFSKFLVDTRVNWTIENVKEYFAFISTRKDLKELRKYVKEMNVGVLMEWVTVFEDHVMTPRVENRAFDLLPPAEKAEKNNTPLPPEEVSKRVADILAKIQKPTPFRSIPRMTAESYTDILMKNISNFNIDQCIELYVQLSKNVVAESEYDDQGKKTIVERFVFIKDMNIIKNRMEEITGSKEQWLWDVEIIPLVIKPGSKKLVENKVASKKRKGIVGGSEVNLDMEYRAFRDSGIKDTNKTFDRDKYTLKWTKVKLITDGTTAKLNFGKTGGE